MNTVNRFLKDEEGATAIEYGLIAALIAVAIIVAVRGLGTATEDLYTFITTTINNAL